ncbi:unnamed protein product [Urochloa humidicola]
MGFAGTKRKGAPFASPAVCAARPCKSSSGAPATATSESSPTPTAAMGEEDWRDWASLLPDLTEAIAARVLAADVVDYISLRATCTRWRACAPCPRDPTLRDARLRPRGWVALCNGDGVRPADACEVAFLHTATGRCVRVRLPELHGYRIVGFTDGLLVLLNKDTTAVRVLHPFTRVAVDLPPIAAIFNHMVKDDQQSQAWMRAAVCLSQTSDSIAVVAWFPDAPGVVVAEPSFPCWYILYHNIELATAVSFQGRVYGVIATERQVVQVYPQCLNRYIAHIPSTFGIPQANSFFLVESATRLILVVRHSKRDNNIEGYQPCGFALFEVDTVQHRELNPLSSLDGQALFISRDRCLSVSHNKLHSITGNAIYFDSEDLYPIILYSVSSGRFEVISKLTIIHDFTKRIRPSVRPFTLVDHLFTFWNHRQWSRGLMFHEYHCIPSRWKNLFKKFKAQDCEVQIKNLEGSMFKNIGLAAMKAPCNKNNCFSPSYFG